MVGTTAQGQSHETMYKILMSEKLGLEFDDVVVIQGDTDKVVWGTGTFGSRSAVIGGSAVWRGAEKIIDKGRKIAAHVLEAAEGDIEFADGAFVVSGTDRKLSLKEVARAAFQPGRLPPSMEPGLFETGVFDPSAMTFPNGCHVCEIEIDRETGGIEVLRYLAVDDVGTVINALTLHGQIHGGVVQGIGQALSEAIVYDPKSGQLVSGSFMDYGMPRADSVCAFELEDNVGADQDQPLGRQGRGGGGNGRRAAGDHERGARRAETPGRQAYRDAAHARDRVAHDPGKKRSRMIAKKRRG